MIEITIDGQKISVEKGTTILEAARSLGISIPTLCHHEGLPPDGNCRLCQVEVTDNRGRTKLEISCMYPVRGPIDVQTNTERVRAARSFVIRLLLNRSPNSEVIQKLAEEYDVKPLDERFSDEPDPCIRCGRCVRACELLGNNCIAFVKRGWEKEVATAFYEAPEDCLGCGSCADVCPTGAISVSDNNGIRKIWGTEFKLVACSRCGREFATEKQVAAAAPEDVDANVLTLCPACRKRYEADQIRIE